MKPGFSYREHDEASRSLQKVRDYLAFLTVEVSNSYGKSSAIAKKTKRAAEAVDKLRFDLADELHRENPDELDAGALDFYQRQNKYEEKSSSGVKI